jgi:predicted lipid-binding transport protein (Tim44 family)
MALLGLFGLFGLFCLIEVIGDVRVRGIEAMRQFVTIPLMIGVTVVVMVMMTGCSEPAQPAQQEGIAQQDYIRRNRPGAGGRRRQANIKATADRIAKRQAARQAARQAWENDPVAQAEWKAERQVWREYMAERRRTSSAPLRLVPAL